MTYSEQEVKEYKEKLLENITEGSTVRDAIKASRLSSSTFYRWLEDDVTFAKQYARAMEINVENMADEILDIVDDSSMDYTENEEGMPVFNREHVQRTKLRVDARMWLMSKRMAKKYGNKVDVTTEGEKLNASPISVVLGVVDAEKKKK